MPLKRIPILLGFWLAAIFMTGGACSAEIYTSRVFSVDQAVYAVRFSPAGDRVALATDAGTVIFDTSDGKQMAELKGKASSVAWSPDGSMLMVGTGEALRFWNVPDYSKEFAAIPLDAQTLIFGLPREPFSPDGKSIVVLRRDDTAAVWQIEGRREVVILKGHTGTVTDANFSPDGGRVATTADDRTARVWNAATGKEIARLEGHGNAVRKVRFSPDGTRILTVGRDQTVRVWNAASGKAIATLRHQAGVNSAAFDREGKRIVTGAADGVARVFDATSGDEILALRGNGAGKVLSAAFGPDGSRIATGSSDDDVRIWDVGSGKQIVKLNSLSDGHGAGFIDDARIMVTPHGTVGVIYTLQQQHDDVRLPAGIAGMWGLAPPEGIDATAEELHIFCSTSPYIIHPDGLVEFLAGGEGGLLEPRQFMRCKVDLTCDVFEGAPHSLSAKPVDKATFRLANGKGTMCIASYPDRCDNLRKCSKLKWSAEACASGHAAQWEKLFAEFGN